MSRVFRSETAKTRSVWIPSLEFESVDTDESDESGSLLVLEETSMQVATLLESAKAQAHEIVEEAKKKASEYHEEARKAGFSEGYNEGFQKGLGQAEQLISQAKEVLEQSRTAFSQYLEACEPYLVAMTLEIAKKIVGDAIQCDPEIALSMIRQAISVLDDESSITINVNPEIVAIIEGSKQNLEGQYNNRRIEVVGDPSISIGALVESPRGQVDATIETQIANIARAIGEARTRQHRQGAV